MNHSFVPDQDFIKEETNEQIENGKDQEQELAPEVKEFDPEVPPLNLPGVVPAEPSVQIPDEGFVLGITVHQTDPLEMDYHIRHPMVRIHIVDKASGNYLPKLDKLVQNSVIIKPNYVTHFF